MYLDFYHLKRKPFHVTPDPEFLYLSSNHREALASIVYGVEQKKGIIEVIGEVGTGKTTILRSYLGLADPERVKAAYVFNPNVSFPVLLKNIFQELGIAPESRESHEMVEQFYLFLIDEYKKGHTIILVIDEAQNMPVETLENLRLLSNLETTTDKLLQIVLCGQPELENHLGRKELRQLRQRIAVRTNISPLSRKESLAYIRHRLSKAYCKTDIFIPAALARIVQRAKGNPRVINILCDNALITGYGYQEKKVSSRTAMEIISDLEGKSSLKDQGWRIAGRSFHLPKKDPAGAAADVRSLFHSTDPLFVEQYKIFSARFEYRARVLGCKVVAVTSAIAGEGKTVSAMNLAANLASIGRKKVLLVDVDMRKPDLAKGIGVSPVPGLSEFLAGSAGINDIVRDSVAPGLAVIPGGMRISDPGELITGERFRALLLTSRNRFDVVLLDAPPIIPVSDALALRDLVDGFVLVYRLGFTPHPMFGQSLEEIGEKKLLGVLLNGAARHPERYYQKYYGKYLTKLEASSRFLKNGGARVGIDRRIDAVVFPA